MALAACEEAGLDRLFFIPAAQSPFKPGCAPTPAAERLRLLRLALAGKSHYEIDEQEIKRGGISYSIDTVRDYARRFPDAELFYLIGADHVPSLPKWREAEELARLVEFLAIPRPGQTDVAFAPPFRGRTCKAFRWAFRPRKSGHASRLAGPLTIWWPRPWRKPSGIIIFIFDQPGASLT